MPEFPSVDKVFCVLVSTKSFLPSSCLGITAFMVNVFVSWFSSIFILFPAINLVFIKFTTSLEISATEGFFLTSSTKAYN